MTQEARVQTGLTIRKGNLNYQSQPTFFNADVAATNGPTPGAILVPTTGVAASLAQLAAMGGLCWLNNLSASNFITYGVKTGGFFVPFGELLPGESVPFRLSRYLLTGISGTGHTGELWFVADTASCRVRVDGFDK